MKARITKRAIDSVSPAEKKDVLLWDTDLKGFGCKVTPKGKRVFILQYRVGGRQRRYTIGQLGALTPDQARKEAARLLGKVAGGIDPTDTKIAGKEAPTIADLADKYLAEHAEVKKKSCSVQEDRRMLKQFILPALGHLKVSNVNRQDVTRLHHSLRDTPYQGNRVLALLSKMFNLAEKWGFRPDGSNPCRHVDKFKEKKRERYLSADELSRLGNTLARIESEGSELPSVLTAIRLLILTGARLSEILELKWDYVDQERGLLALPDSKTGAKLIPLGRAAIEVLENAPRLAGNPYVCPGVNPGSHLVGLPKAWRRIRNDAGLKDVRLHDLRHSFASVAAASGHGLPVIGALLGHKEAATTARYAHLANNPLRESADQITSQIVSAMNRKPSGNKVIKLTVNKK